MQDLFLNETAKFAHVFLPGSSFLEKNGTFTNAERRISPVRKVMEPLGGKEDWEITVRAEQRARLPDALHPPVRDHGRDRAAHADVHRRELREARSAGQHPVAVQRRGARGHAGDAPRTPSCAARASSSSPSTCPTEEKVNRKYPLILTTGRILSQYNVGAQTRRTANVDWHDEDRLEIHPHDAEERGIKEGDWVGVVSRAGETTLRARITERVQPGVVYTTFHHPESGANVVTTENSDWATNCPEYKVTAVQVMPVFHSSEWQSRFKRFTEQQLSLLDAPSSGHERRAPGEHGEPDRPLLRGLSGPGGGA